MKVMDDEHFQAEVDVCISPTFFGWCFQFAGEMEIVGSEEVRMKYLNMKFEGEKKWLYSLK